MLIYQNTARANLVIEAITDSVGPDTIEYHVAVAYVTREGASALAEALADRVGQAWNTIPKTIVTCFDFGGTEPAALEYLRTHGFVVRIANLGAEGIIRITSNPSSYHPKLYLARTSEGARAIVGSANLSRRALSVNTEIVAALELTDELSRAVWNEIVLSSVELTDELLEAYRKARPQQRATPEPDEPPVPPLVEPDALPLFRAAVENGDVEPTEYQAFWVEVGGPSGESGNQLELPRRAHRFFGYEFDDYNDDHHLIGEPTLVANGGLWACLLTWHGNNKMERVNLPTTARSGLMYADQVVLLQRSGDSFEITVAPPDSPRAARWRNESAAAGTLFRFGQRSNRRCGLI